MVALDSLELLITLALISLRIQTLAVALELLDALLLNDLDTATLDTSLEADLDEEEIGRDTEILAVAPDVDVRLLFTNAPPPTSAMYILEADSTIADTGLEITTFALDEETLLTEPLIGRVTDMLVDSLEVEWVEEEIECETLTFALNEELLVTLPST